MKLFYIIIVVQAITKVTELSDPLRTLNLAVGLIIILACARIITIQVIAHLETVVSIFMIAVTTNQAGRLRKSGGKNRKRKSSTIKKRNQIRKKNLKKI